MCSHMHTHSERERERERERDTSAAAYQTSVFSESPDGNIKYNLLPSKVGKPKYSRMQNLVSYKNQGILSDDEKKEKKRKKEHDQY